MIQGDALLSKIFNFALEYLEVAGQPVWLEIKKGTYQLLVYADYVTILGRSVHTMKKNIEALVVVSTDIQLEVSADKTTVHGHVSRSECSTMTQHKD